MTGYGAATLTITAKDTNYSLLGMIVAIGAYQGAKFTCREVTIQSPTANGNAIIWKGADNMTNTFHGPELLGGQSITNRSDKNNIPLSETYLRSDTDGVTVNVEWMYG